MTNSDPRGPYVMKPFDPERHCGHAVERDPVKLQAKADSMQAKLDEITKLSYEDKGVALGPMAKRLALARGSILHKLDKLRISGPDDRPCMNLKGARTEHPGSGHCYKHCFCHGHANRHGMGTKHGIYATTTSVRLLSYLDKIDEANTDLLDLTPDVKMLKAKLLQFLDDSDKGNMELVDQVKGLTLMSEALRRMVDTINEMKLRTAITKEVFDVIMARMADVVMKYVTDPEIVDKIAGEWTRISIDPNTRRQRALAGGSE